MLNQSARLLRRIALTVLGVGVLGLGIAMLVLPGPGFLVVALGFFILSLEYEWARSRFERARKKAADLADQAAANRFSSAFTILFGLGMVAAGVAWIVIDTLPASSGWSGGSLIFSGLVVLATMIVSLRQAKQARDAGLPTPAELLEEQGHERQEPGRTTGAPRRPAGEDGRPAGTEPGSGPVNGARLEQTAPTARENP